MKDFLTFFGMWTMIAGVWLAWIGMVMAWMGTR